MKKSVNVIFALTLLLIAVVAVSGCAQYGGQQQQQGEQGAQEQQAATPPAPPVSAAAAAATANTVEITATGFSPGTLTVKVGDSVVFENKEATQHWPASAVHPTHAVYPEPGGCIGSKFDACKGLAQGETFTFTFNGKGSWKYHDHLNPSLRGTIVVE